MEDLKQVWAVIQGYDYEGENFSSLKLFKLEADALAYKESIGTNTCDYQLMKPIDIN